MSYSKPHHKSVLHQAFGQETAGLASPSHKSGLHGASRQPLPQGNGWLCLLSFPLAAQTSGFSNIPVRSASHPPRAASVFWNFLETKLAPCPPHLRASTNQASSSPLTPPARPVTTTLAMFVLTLPSARHPSSRHCPFTFFSYPTVHYATRFGQALPENASQLASLFRATILRFDSHPCPGPALTTFSRLS